VGHFIVALLEIYWQVGGERILKMDQHLAKLEAKKI